MNNKYDVQNFSKLIDTFDLKKEVKTVTEYAKEACKSLRFQNEKSFTHRSIFEPYLASDLKDSSYKF